MRKIQISRIDVSTQTLEAEDRLRGRGDSPPHIPKPNPLRNHPLLSQPIERTGNRASPLRRNPKINT